MPPPAGVLETLKDVTDILSTLIEHGLASDQNFPAAKQHSATAWEVTFDGAQHVSLGMGVVDYPELYEELSGRRVYSVKLIDGAIVQMMYRFDGEILLKHRLAFYPSATLRPFHETPQDYIEDELYADIVARRIVPFPLRFDFDRASAVDVHHPHCHMTLGDALGCRIPVTSGVSPRWFAEFLLRNFYQTDMHEFVSKLPPHRIAFDRTITANEQRLMHLVVPH